MQLTQREFLFLEDAMAAERLGVVYFQDLAEHCTDPQLREMCLQLSRQSLQHFDRLLSLLNQSEGGQGTFQVGMNQGAWQTQQPGSFGSPVGTGSMQPGGGFTQ